jgi:hypothetical protein
MSSAEGNYDIHDKELLAIVAVFQEWRVYLEGSKYLVKVLIDRTVDRNWRGTIKKTERYLGEASWAGGNPRSRLGIGRKDRRVGGKSLVQL